MEEGHNFGVRSLDACPVAFIVAAFLDHSVDLDVRLIMHF